jgi:hypothetical protein
MPVRTPPGTLAPAGHKRCNQCCLILPHQRFGRDRSKKDGLFYCCRRCNKQRMSRGDLARRLYSTGGWT